MTEARLAELEKRAKLLGETLLGEVCAEVRRLKRVSSAFSEEVSACAGLHEIEKLAIRKRAWTAVESIEDATNPVCSPEAAEDARQAFKKAVATGEIELTPGSVTADDLRGFEKHRITRPRAGGVLPDPGHEAARARAEVAALWKDLTAANGYADHLKDRIERLESFEKDATRRVLEMDKIAAQQTDALLACGRRLNALEGASHMRAGLRERVCAFLKALDREAIRAALPAGLMDERLALLEALGE